MIINNSTNNYPLNSYNMQQKVHIINSICIETSYAKCRALRLFHFAYRARIPPMKCSVPRGATHRISEDIRNFLRKSCEIFSKNFGLSAHVIFNSGGSLPFVK